MIIIIIIISGGGSTSCCRFGSGTAVTATVSVTSDAIEIRDQTNISAYNNISTTIDIISLLLYLPASVYIPDLRGQIDAVRHHHVLDRRPRVALLQGTEGVLQIHAQQRLFFIQ